MQNIVNSFRSLGLQGEKLTMLTVLLTRQNYPKGHILITELKREASVYFLEEGLARVFFHSDDKEVTFCFCVEGDVLMSVKSYFEEEPGYESIELLEDSTVYKIKHKTLQQLYEHDIDLANWGRKLAEQEFIKADKRFMAQQFKTATERYHDFLKTYPTLIQRVQLGHIASYLGISQVSLSRIRSGFRQDLF